MSDKSRIEWTDATWNPVTGCAKVSQGCKNCYAERDWARLSAPRTPPNIYTGRDFTNVRCHPERLAEPYNWARPRRIFVNSMSDLFHPDVPFEFIASVFSIMAITCRHTYQVLTKRPERMLEFFAWVHEEIGPDEWAADEKIFEHKPADITLRPWRENKRHGGYDNCGPKYPYQNAWIGVSVEDQATADERIPLLLKAPAALRWVSVEPLLAPIDIKPFLFRNQDPRFRICPRCLYTTNMPETSCPNDLGPLTVRDIALDWVVAGGESGPNARPSHPAWFRSIRDQCVSAGVPFFFKQWGNWMPMAPQYPKTEDEIEQSDSADYGLEHEAVELDGTIARDYQPHDGAYIMGRVPKKQAGRELDGRTWDEYPEPLITRPWSPETK